jgi:hypothetical protein
MDSEYHSYPNEYSFQLHVMVRCEKDDFPTVTKRIKSEYYQCIIAPELQSSYQIMNKK